MPFSNLWSKVIPAGGVQAKLLDDHARQLRLDLEERFQQLFEPSVVGDLDHPQPISFARDPLVLANAIIGKKLDKKLVIPFSAFVKETLGKEVDYDIYKLTAFTDSAPLVAPIILPPGVTLKRAELFSDRVDAGSIIMNIRKRAFLAGQPRDDSQIIATKSNVVGGVRIDPTPDFVEVIDANVLYYIEIEAAGTAGNSFQLYGVRLTYDAPSALMTL